MSEVSVTQEGLTVWSFLLQGGQKEEEARKKLGEGVCKREKESRVWDSTHSKRSQDS